MIVLITGPVRSGKSARAARLARQLGRPVTYIATARVDPGDREMNARIARHRAEREVEHAVELWHPGVSDLPALLAAADASATLLVDSVGTWLAGHLLDLEALAAVDALAAAASLEMLCEPVIASIVAARANVVLVAEETGWGVVPDSAQGRIFRDQLGRLVQRIAVHADRTELVVAGFALDLKACGVPI